MTEKNGIPLNEGLIKKGGVNSEPISPRPSSPPPSVKISTDKKNE